MDGVPHKPLFTLTLTNIQILPEGKREIGDRLVGIVGGGTFEGDRLRGVVLPGGNDWLFVRDGGERSIDVRLPLQTNDGAIIAMSYRGFARVRDEARARAISGQALTPADLAVRMVAFFETRDPRYSWINRVMALGLGQPRVGAITYDLVEFL